MTPPLTPEDLAYMREVQAEHRPVAATISARTQTTDGMGGRTSTYAPGEPIMVRLDGNDEIPGEVAAQHGINVVKVTMDLVEVRAGDRITVSATEGYEVVSEGDPDRWATAQVVYAVRTVFPA